MRLAALVVLFLFGAFPGVAQAEKRIALVIGNSAYTATSPLANPKNDAELMTRTLEASGFEVTKIIDADQRAMKQAMLDFGRKLRDGVDASLFYYAGHGVQGTSGENFLIPVDAAISDEGELDLLAVDLNAFLRVMQNSGSKVNIVVLDACRNNPFASAFRSASRGLSMVDAPRGTYIAYSTSPGEVAEDGASGNSPYTLALAEAMARPGLKLEDTFKEARRLVLAATGEKQVPWETSSITGDFYFRHSGTGSAGASPATPGAADQETAFWNTVKDSTNPADFEAYLRQYPDGAFAPLAGIRLGLLTPVGPDVPAATPPSAAADDCPAGVVASVGNAGVADAAKRCLEPGDTFRDCPDCPEMVVIPAGTFMMGSPPTEKDLDATEAPQRAVAIGYPLAVGKLEVTRGEFAAFIAETGHDTGSTCWTYEKGAWQERSRTWRAPGFTQDDSHPVTCVNWHDAQAYLSWLTRKTGETYRLLSEAEWEYAARAGTTSARYWPDNGENALCESSNSGDRSAPAKLRYARCSDGFERTAPAGSFAANGFGLHDMLGNLWEWVEDCQTPNYSGAPIDGSASTSGDCLRRVLRGGAWSSPPKVVRVAYRNNEALETRHSIASLRVARVLRP